MGGAWQMRCKVCKHSFWEGAAAKRVKIRCHRCGWFETKDRKEYEKMFDELVHLLTELVEKVNHDLLMERLEWLKSYEGHFARMNVLRGVAYCPCGGLRSVRAQPRCPACSSTRIEEDPEGWSLMFRG